MTEVECVGCHKRLPMNSTVKIGDRPFCEGCANADSSDRSQWTSQHDPTVCVGCTTDFGSTQLGTLSSGLPVCEPCRERLLNRPFPPWVKIGLVVVLGLAVFCFVRNWRFLRGYSEFRHATKAILSGDVVQASALMSRAASDVPESEDFAGGARVYRAMVLLGQDKPSDALPLLRAYVARHGENDYVASLLRTAEYGDAFYRKEYDRMVVAAQAIADAKPGSMEGALCLVSAYSCRYAASGDPQSRELALRYLDQANAAAGANIAQNQDDMARMRHRLDTREIISPAEYHKRFPSGYKGGAQTR